MLLLEPLGLILLASLFGAMVFLPSVVAPLVFRALPEEAAAGFLRALFPRYYAFQIVTAAAAAFCYLARPWLAAGLLLIALSTLGVRQALVPRINDWRDREAAGDAVAGRHFVLGHRASVLVNLAQLVFAGAALWTLAT